MGFPGLGWAGWCWIGRGLMRAQPLESALLVGLCGPPDMAALSPAVNSHQKCWALGGRLQEQLGHKWVGACRSTPLTSAHASQQGALSGHLLRRGGDTLPGRPFPSALIFQPARVRETWLVGWVWMRPDTWTHFFQIGFFGTRMCPKGGSTHVCK